MSTFNRYATICDTIFSLVDTVLTRKNCKTVDEAGPIVYDSIRCLDVEALLAFLIQTGDRDHVGHLLTLRITDKILENNQIASIARLVEEEEKPTPEPPKEVSQKVEKQSAKNRSSKPSSPKAKKQIYEVPIDETPTRVEQVQEVEFLDEEDKFEEDTFEEDKSDEEINDTEVTKTVSPIVKNTVKKVLMITPAPKVTATAVTNDIDFPKLEKEIKKTPTKNINSPTKNNSSSKSRSSKKSNSSKSTSPTKTSVVENSPVVETVHAEKPWYEENDESSSSEPVSWADLTEEDRIAAEKKKADMEKKKEEMEEKLKGLSWALRTKLATVPVEQFDEALAHEQMLSKKAAEEAKRQAILQAKKKQREEAEKKKLQLANKAKFDIFYSMTPEMSEKKITNQDIMSQLAEIAKATAESGADKDGFTKVNKNNIRPAIKTSARADHPNVGRAKTVTSAKWFLFPENPILTEAKDLHLWAYDYDEEGRPVPIGWWRDSMQKPCNRFRINNASKLIHVRNEDNSWHTEEEFVENGVLKHKILERSTVRWLLTPPAMRTGPCPTSARG